jgi:aminopeptidase N
MQADSLDAARAIRQPAHTLADIINAFDAITYLKGAAVLRMLEDFIGHDAMRAGIHRHLAAHAFGTASSADLFSQLGKATAEPLGKIFAPFLKQPGLPVITARPAGSLCRRTLLQALGQVGSPSAAAAARTALLEGHGSGSEILLLLRQQMQQPSLRLTTWELGVQSSVSSPLFVKAP